MPRTSLGLWYYFSTLGNFSIVLVVSLNSVAGCALSCSYVDTRVSIVAIAFRTLAGPLGG